MKSSERSTWSVGELAARFDLATHVLRHWEDKGLLRPQRDPSGRRRYGKSDAYQVAVIIASKEAGMSLDQIRALIDGGAEDRRRILRGHLDDLETRMAAMERSRHLTEHALDCRAHDIATCPNFRAGVADIVAGARVGLWDESHAEHAGPAGSGR